MRLLLGFKIVQQKDSQNKRHGILQDYSAGCSSFEDLRQIYNRNIAKASNKLLSCTRNAAFWGEIQYGSQPSTINGTQCPYFALFWSKYNLQFRPELTVQIFNGVSIHGAFLHLRTKGITLTSLDIVEFKLPFEYRLIYCGLEMKQILFGFLELDCIFELDCEACVLISVIFSSSHDF